MFRLGASLARSADAQEKKEAVKILEKVVKAQQEVALIIKTARARHVPNFPVFFIPECRRLECRNCKIKI